MIWPLNGYRSTGSFVLNVLAYAGALLFLVIFWGGFVVLFGWIGGC